MSDRKNRRAAYVKSKRAARKGPPPIALGVSELDPGQQHLLKTHGRESPLIFRALLWWLRDVFDKARAEGEDKGKEVVPTFWTLSGTDEEPTWRSGSHPNAHEVQRSKVIARKAGALGSIMSTSKDAPDGERGHSLILEHEAFGTYLEQHHWSAKYGWRVYDGAVRLGTDHKPEIAWTPPIGDPMSIHKNVYVADADVDDPQATSVDQRNTLSVPEILEWAMKFRPDLIAQVHAEQLQGDASPPGHDTFKCQACSGRGAVYQQTKKKGEP